MHAGVSAPRLRDVAREAGVSVSAVSYVLNGRPGVSHSTRDRVLEVAERIGYRHRSRSRNSASTDVGTLSAVLSSTRRHGEAPNYFVAELLAGVEQEARLFGFKLNVGWWSAEQAGRPSDPDVRGLLFLGGAFDPEVLARIRRPAVLIGTSFPGLKLDTVLADSRTGIYLAASHLLRQGYRRLALLNGPARSATTSAKQLGFQDALIEGGLSWQEAMASRIDFTVEAGEEAAKILLRSAGRPDAMVTGDDVIAIGALHAAAGLGMRVPQDIAIVGFGDSPVSSLMRPALTSVHVFLEEMGRLGVRRLLDRLREGTGELDQRAPWVRSLVGPRLVVRDSSVREPVANGASQ